MIWSRILKTSGCAFSTSSIKMRQQGLRRTASVSFPPSPYPTKPEKKRTSWNKSEDQTWNTPKSCLDKCEGLLAIPSPPEPWMCASHLMCHFLMSLTWWSSNQLAHRVSLHILAHVQPDHCISAPKVLLCQDLGKLCLANTWNKEALWGTVCWSSVSPQTTSNTTFVEPKGPCKGFCAH
jgi:hypothetical protein